MQNEPPAASPSPESGAPSAQTDTPMPPYGAPGAYPPPPGYAPPGYTPPGYAPPDHTQPGYPPPDYPPYSWQPGYPRPYYPGPMPPSTSYFAIASLACALCGIFLFIPFGATLGALLGIIFGHVALADIGRSRGMKVGRGMALAGLIIGYLILALLVLAILLLVSFRRSFLHL